MNPLWANGATSETDTTTRKNATSWNENEKAAAYLCIPVISKDSNLPWISYYDENKANYVIGGASVEMFIKSYNQTHDKNANGNEALSCGYQYTNTPGYVYQVYGATQNNGFWTKGGTLDYTNYNNMYCGRNGSKYGDSHGFWLASPSALVSQNVCLVFCINKVMSNNYYYNVGDSLSPLVSLKSDVEIEIYE